MEKRYGNVFDMLRDAVLAAQDGTAMFYPEEEAHMLAVIEATEELCESYVVKSN